MSKKRKGYQSGGFPVNERKMPPTEPVRPPRRSGSGPSVVPMREGERFKRALEDAGLGEERQGGIGRWMDDARKKGGFGADDELYFRKHGGKVPGAKGKKNLGRAPMKGK